jgi:serine/threonine protein kinase
MTLETGSRLGPYEIVSAAGAGGMGEVYKARDTRLDRTVAVKVLPSHLSEDPRLREPGWCTGTSNRETPCSQGLERSFSTSVSRSAQREG